jgi:hypothetical protein
VVGCAGAEPSIVWHGSADHPDSILWPVSALSVEYEEDGAKVAKIVILCQHVQKKHGEKGSRTALCRGRAEHRWSDTVGFAVMGRSYGVFGRGRDELRGGGDRGGGGGERERQPRPLADPQGRCARYRLQPQLVSHHAHLKDKHKPAPVLTAKNVMSWCLRYSAITLASGKDLATSAEDVVYIVGNVGSQGIGIFDEGPSSRACPRPVTKTFLHECAGARRLVDHSWCFQHLWLSPAMGSIPHESSTEVFRGGVADSKNVLGRMTVGDLAALRLDELEMLVQVKGKSQWIRRAKPETRAPVFQPANAELSLHWSQPLGLW